MGAGTAGKAPPLRKTRVFLLRGDRFSGRIIDANQMIVPRPRPVRDPPLVAGFVFLGSESPHRAASRIRHWFTIRCQTAEPPAIRASAVRVVCMVSRAEPSHGERNFGKKRGSAGTGRVLLRPYPEQRAIAAARRAANLIQLSAQALPVCSLGQHLKPWCCRERDVAGSTTDAAPKAESPILVNNQPVAGERRPCEALPPSSTRALTARELIAMARSARKAAHGA